MGHPFANFIALRTDTESCGLGRSLQVISGKWKSTIIWHLHEQPRGFGELRRMLPGISEKILSAQLRDLEAEGVAVRVIFDGPVVRTSYSLTSAGEPLNAAVHALADWGRSYPQSPVENDRAP
jgi:DNA-binding HxlR family transcriptional regulator